jgi:hypothetical protein
VDIKISDSKDPFGDTEVRLINHAEVIARIREEVAQALCVRAEAEGREPTATELEEAEAVVRSVPAEITLSEEALARPDGVDVDEMILSGFFPVHRPVGARIVQAHLSIDFESTFSTTIKEAVRIRRASGVDDDTIRAQIASSMARALDQGDAETRERTARTMAQAIDEALAESTETPPESRKVMVKNASRMIAGLVKAGRKEGLSEAALRERLENYLAEMTTTMEKMRASGMQAAIVEDSLRAYRQAIAEVVGPESPVPLRLNKRNKPQ